MPDHCVAGRGFSNLSQVNMARHTPTGQLVAVKQTNLDECTEEELLQLMVSSYTGRSAAFCTQFMKVKCSRCALVKITGLQNQGPILRLFLYRPCLSRVEWGVVVHPQMIQGASSGTVQSWSSFSSHSGKPELAFRLFSCFLFSQLITSAYFVPY